MKKEKVKNKISLVVIDEKNYPEKLDPLLKKSYDKKRKICYVCINKPYKEMVEYLKKIDLNPSNFFFIDTLSSHYQLQEPEKNCIFLETPINLENIKEAITEAIIDHKCEEVFLDNMSSLLQHQRTFFILKFIYGIRSKYEEIEAKKNYESTFIILKNSDFLEEDNKKLTNDLKMFSDKIIELNEE